MNGKTVGIIIAVVVVLAGLAWYFSSSAGSMSGMPGMGTATSTDSSGGVTGTASSTSMSFTVDYTNQGFSPSTITIPLGATVTWVNDSSENLWVASDPHPTHQGYDGTTRTVHCAAGYAGPTPFDECTSVPAGGSYAFTFNQVGSWGYHNHADDGVRGTVVVTAPPTGVEASTTVNTTL